MSFLMVAFSFQALFATENGKDSYNQIELAALIREEEGQDMDKLPVPGEVERYTGIRFDLGCLRKA
ncbi:MAG: hypothetical protein WAM44_10175 [Chthoniobacterales bacterium]